ncbi:Catalase [Polaromonas vacuolata]|uniref:Catalase n=1 Tax=Polaromonas vacuolata TaxID=37448 RepID=A0A6H2HB89_9BURK|nr:catalase [Polaromonas vacuolata]QJC57063.1 Catalase [Polaromonas vacuolata]
MRSNSSLPHAASSRSLNVITAALLLSVSAAASAALAPSTLTRDNGAPVGDNQNSQTAGPTGPTLLQDAHLLQKLQRFDRERVPERVVHARGTGAHGVFTVSDDISDLSRAKVFTMGSQTPVFVRFSAVIHGSHSPETLRDPRGFATKFYTTEGNWDLVGNNLPVFFIRDAMKFPDMVHSLKPAPDTNLQDPNRFFDFFSQTPEATHMLTRLYTDYGIPKNYRTMDGNGVHAYKFINAAGQYSYVKFHWKSQQGEHNLTGAQAAKIQSTDFNHATRDLISAINKGDFPKWDLFVQVLKPEQLASFDFDALDATKIWPGLPERKIGTMTLNRNPGNIFQETEQSAFAPSNVVPGIETSEDRLLQGRLFSYADTQSYRIGANALQLPINRPRNQVVSNNQDGSMNAGMRTGSINYEPSRLSGVSQDEAFKSSALPLVGSTQQARITKTLNFRQAGEYYRSLTATEKKNLISNLAGDLGQVTHQDTLYAMLSFFQKADPEYGRSISAAVSADPIRVAREAAALRE